MKRRPAHSARRPLQKRRRARLRVRVNAKTRGTVGGRAGSCRECAAPFMARRATREFCSEVCRTTFHNRRLRRGAELYDAVMAWRFDRDEANNAGALNLICRMAGNFRAEDERIRAGRPSWDPIAKIKNRIAHHAATVVSLSAAGVGLAGALR